MFHYSILNQFGDNDGDGEGMPKEEKGIEEIQPEGNDDNNEE